MAATTQMSSVSEFNPRLRLDLSSGQNSLRSLKESMSRLPKPPNAPPQLPGGEGEHAFMMPVVDYDKAITLMRGHNARFWKVRNTPTCEILCGGIASRS